MLMNDPGYVFSHRLPLLKGAQAAGYDVHLACPRIGPRAAELAERGVSAHEVPLERGLTGVRQLGRGLLRLGRLLVELRPSVLHCVTLQHVALGGPLAELHRVPLCVYSIHGLGSTFISQTRRARALRAGLEPALRALLRSPRARTIVQNEDDAEFLVKARLCAPEQLFQTHGSGVDTDRFSPAPAPAGPLQVVLGSRMIADKGIGEFAQAARLLRRRGCNARFVLAGPLDPRNATGVSTRQLESWQREAGVEWRGAVGDMAGLLRASHVACLPSYREGLPKFLAEAAACGVPVVTTDVPGCRAAVRPGVTGLTVPPRNSEALAEALATLLCNPNLRAAMGAAGRKFALERFAAARVVAQCLRVYASTGPIPGAKRSVAPAANERSERDRSG